MKWSSVLSTEDNLEVAFEHASRDLLENLQEQPTVVFVFLSPFYHLHFEQAPELFDKYFPDSVVIGCSAYGIIAGGVEIEDSVGVGLIGACMPDVKAIPFHLNDSHIDPLELAPQDEGEPHMVVFSDPLTFDHSEFLSRLNESEKQTPIIGGLASGSTDAAYNVLFLNGRIYKSGAVGLILTGNIMLEQFASQGSKGLGVPCFATRVRGNIIYELDGFPAELVVANILDSVEEDERILFEEDGVLGVYEEPSYDESTESSHDVRQIISMDSGTSSVILDEPIAQNSIVRLMIGDPYQSHEFLLENLERLKSRTEGGEHSGALVFSCARRGEGFYNDQNHEANVFKKCFDSVPLGGFYSFGELVQDNGKARVCGFTSTFGFFKPRR